jgi:hypothetical protein
LGDFPLFAGICRRAAAPIHVTALIEHGYGDERRGTVQIGLSNGGTAMKTIISVVIALSVLAGIAAPASALDAKSFYEQLDRQAGG